MRASAKSVLCLCLLAAPAFARDLVFQSKDGETIIVASDAPEVSDDSPGDTGLVTLMRKGRGPRVFRASELLEPEELRIEKGRIAWLAGHGSRTVRAGAQLRLASGRTLLVPFDGNLRKKPAVILVAPPACPCSYTDGAGTLHVVDTAEEVPRRYWSLAKPLDDTNLQVMPMPPPPPRPEAPQEPSPPAEAGRHAAASPPPPRPRPENYYEYIKRITGQRGPQDRVDCIGNDGKPTPCDFEQAPGR